MNLQLLNEKQREAVLCEKGPLLILAGAGSGKTKTLTTRIAYLVDEKGYSADSILAITFTNKAAKEMKKRLRLELGLDANSIWMGTFHSFALRILRIHADKIGYTKNFIIYDSYDQKQLVKNCIEELGFSSDYYQSGTVKSIINNCKSKMIRFSDYKKHLDDEYVSIYELYEKKLKSSDSMDFDNIILNLVKLFEENKDILDYYVDKFSEVLVDEYQDTNRLQYHLVNLLTKKKSNLVVVGDDNQSIYGWRGADIRNIIDFKKDYKNAKIIKLEQNYRSTKKILEAANELISNNKNQHKKELWTDLDEGEKVVYYDASSDREEAKFVVKTIRKEISKRTRLEDIAILYRTHSVSRVFEEALRKEGIDYQIIGGLKFYDRKEIKDILAYLRLIVNPKDDISFLRVVNEPKRKIGKTTIEKIVKYSSEHDISLFEALDSMVEQSLLASKSLVGAREFVSLIKSYDTEKMDAYEIVTSIIAESGYIEMLELKKTIENASKKDNLGELVSDIKLFVTEESPYLEEYISNVSLISDADTIDKSKAITLMTIHSAKGLEYKIVFIVGFDDNIIPSYQSKDSKFKFEEERRLCYVAMTRAMKKLYITRAKRRMKFGKLMYHSPSEFISEIPAKLLDEINVPESLDREFGFNSYQKQVQSKEKNTNKYYVSQKVTHDKFGNGTVVSYNEDTKIIVVAFKNGGVKKLHVDFAPITLEE